MLFSWVERSRADTWRATRDLLSSSYHTLSSRSLAAWRPACLLKTILDHQQIQKSWRDFRLFFTFLQTEIQKSWQLFRIVNVSRWSVTYMSDLYHYVLQYGTYPGTSHSQSSSRAERSSVDYSSTEWLLLPRKTTHYGAFPPKPPHFCLFYTTAYFRYIGESTYH